jgi:DNA-binding CsgD family transcriptional regulator
MDDAQGRRAEPAQRPVDDGSAEPLVGGYPARADLPVEAEAVYARLLRTAPIRESEFIGGLPEPVTARRWLRHFTELGYARADDAGFLHVTPPRTALTAWVMPRELEVDAARRTFDLVARLYAEHREARTGFVEVAEGRTASRKFFYMFMATARQEVRVLERGPYADDIDGNPPEVQVAGLTRGVRYRSAYDTAVMRTATGLAAVRASIAAGEEARVFPGVPVKLVLCDHHRGVVALPRRSGNEFDALVVYPSTLLDALSDVFEVFWRLGVPLRDLGPADGPDDDAVIAAEPTRETQHLLALLTAGLPDDVIARELGVSERTMHRRIRRLQDVLGANTRFQLGVHAARRDWI